MHPDAVRQDPGFRGFTDEQIEQTALRLERAAETYYERKALRRNDGEVAPELLAEKEKEKGS
jgi:hypothetical protein